MLLSACPTKLLNLDSLSRRRSINDIVMVHKIVNKIANMKHDDFFKMQPSNTRGSRSKLSYGKARSSVRQHFFVNRAGSEYVRLSKNNLLPISVPAFRKFVRKMLRPESTDSRGAWFSPLVFYQFTCFCLLAGFGCVVALIVVVFFLHFLFFLNLRSHGYPCNKYQYQYQ